MYVSSVPVSFASPVPAAAGTPFSTVITDGSELSQLIPAASVRERAPSGVILQILGRMFPFCPSQAVI